MASDNKQGTTGTSSNAAPQAPLNLLDYKSTLSDNFGTRNVYFSPTTYPEFDGVIIQKTGMSAAGTPLMSPFNQSDPHYREFDGLRRNIALMRAYLDDGKASLGDEHDAHGKMLTHMAGMLGKQLASDHGAYSFLQKASVPDKGIAVMYDYLYEHQDKSMFKRKPQGPLPPRAESPFSDANMQRYSRSNMMVQIVDTYDNKVLTELRAPENLTIDDQATSVAIARDILERLRNLQTNPEAKARESDLSDNNYEKSKKLLEVAKSFKNGLAVIADAEADLSDGQPSALHNNKIIARGIEAFEKLGYRMRGDTYKMLNEENEPGQARSMFKKMDETPKQHKSEDKGDDSDASLMAQAEAGLKEAARIQAQQRIAARIAQKAAMRAIQKAQKQASQTLAGTSAALQTMKTGTFSKASVYGANASAAKIVRDIQDEAHAKQKEAAISLPNTPQR